MRAISRYLDDLGLTQHLGDSMLPVLNNLVIHMANETTSGHLRNHILLRPCILALAWKIAFLESRFFALPDHDDNGALARNRHQFQSAL